MPEDVILKFAREEYKGKPTNTSGQVSAIISTPTVTPLKVALPTSAFTVDSVEAAVTLQSAMPDGFEVTNLSVDAGTGDKIEVKAPNGKKFVIETDLDEDEAKTMRDDLERWMKANNVSTGEGGLNADDIVNNQNSGG